jgi:hypothetical protein
VTILIRIDVELILLGKVGIKDFSFRMPMKTQNMLLFSLWIVAPLFATSSLCPAQDENSGNLGSAERVAAETSDPLCLATIARIDSPARVLGFFKAQDRDDAIYFYEVTLSKNDHKEANLPTRRELYAVGAIFDTRIDFTSPITKGIPEIQERAREGNTEGQYKEVLLSATFVNNSYVEPHEIGLFQRALPKYREWAATAENVRPVSFQKSMPVSAEGTGLAVEFRWAEDGMGDHKASMLFRSSALDDYEVARQRRFIDGIDLEGVPNAFSADGINALEGALKMSSKAKVYLEKELDALFEKHRNKQDVIEQNFN